MTETRSDCHATLHSIELEFKCGRFFKKRIFPIFLFLPHTTNGQEEGANRPPRSSASE